MSKFPRFLKLMAAATSITTAGFAYDGYQKSVAPSPFQMGAGSLGFTGHVRSSMTTSAIEEQEALLKQLQVAGYFRQESLWKAVNGLKVENPEEVFKGVYIAARRANADQDNPSNFNAKILRKNLGKGTSLSKQDAADLLLYLAQNAFGRNVGQERNELTTQSWMGKYAKDYVENARTLGLVDREAPKFKEYDAGWIAGASRVGLLTRIVDYHNLPSKYSIKVNGEAAILAGQRELWANIDGIAPSLFDALIKAYEQNIDIDNLEVSLLVGDNKSRNEEGMQYMRGLAGKNGIKLEESLPFVKYDKKEDCPPGYFPGRWYANYAEGESRKLTETLMAQDLLATYILGDNNSTIIDTLAEQHKRPDTASTARDAAKKLINDIASGKYEEKKELVILYQTNNPYIIRQTATTQREVDKTLKESGLSDQGYVIKVDGVGFKNKQDVAVLHSTLAALVAERWKSLDENPKEQGIATRKIESLQFQTRDKSEPEEQMPDIMEMDLSGQDTGLTEMVAGWFQNVFDNILE